MKGKRKNIVYEQLTTRPVTRENQFALSNKAKPKGANEDNGICKSDFKALLYFVHGSMEETKEHGTCRPALI